MSEEQKIIVEEVDSVDAPPRARVEPHPIEFAGEPAADKIRRIASRSSGLVRKFDSQLRVFHALFG